MNYIDGDLIDFAKKGLFDVIVHGCNCFSTMGAGLAPQMAKQFGCDKFEMERWGLNIEKLGNIDYETFVLGENAIWNINNGKNNRNEPELTVVNAYTQFHYGIKNGQIPFDYEAFTLCMRKINTVFKHKRIGLPMIGAGLAGGNWDKIEAIIYKELKDCNTTVVRFKK